MSLSAASGAGRISQPPPSADTATEKSLSSSILEPVLKGDHRPLETGVVFDSVSNDPTKCAHRFRLEPLIRYLDGTMEMTTTTTETGGRRPQQQQQQQQRHDVCPVCQARIVLVCDEHVVALPPDDAKDVVTFRYGKQTYRLALKDDDNNKQWWWWQQTGSACTTQERMANVLGMNVNGHMKILHKGKVLYPNDNRSDAEMSQQLLEISQQDWKVTTKKASLVVIGTRTGQEVRRRQGPLYYGWYGAFEWGLTVVLQLTQITLGLLLWPLKLVMRSLPPSTSGNEDRHED